MDQIITVAGMSVFVKNKSLSKPSVSRKLRAGSFEQAEGRSFRITYYFSGSCVIRILKELS
jgi:hypothetical protein